MNQNQIDEINKRFTYHPPTGDQPERYIAIREKAKELAILMTTKGTESRELSLALTNLQQAVMWANASIACHGITAPSNP